MQKVLMLGAGMAKPVRRLRLETSALENETEWETLDVNSSGNPDYLFDLNNLEHEGNYLPSYGAKFDEIHAYDILEHFGEQGDYKGFFLTFRSFHKALVPGGALVGTTPAHDSVWLWSDPGHRRVITGQTLAFLTKDHYKQLGRTRCTDYREYVEPYWWELDFDKQCDSTAFALKTVND